MIKQCMIFTDGFCFPNPGMGGWAFISCYDNSYDAYVEFGHKETTTNNNMELTAILKAMQSLDSEEIATIYSDNMYCVDGVSKWMYKWKRNRWMRKEKHNGLVTVKNVELWKDIFEQKQRLPLVKVEWVRGHDDNYGNEIADSYAEHAGVEQYDGARQIKLEQFL